eukprot:scaffold428040_cov17-Prasinocladus_malaysianus.AAC.2
MASSVLPFILSAAKRPFTTGNRRSSNNNSGAGTTQLAGEIDDRACRIPLLVLDMMKNMVIISPPLSGFVVLMHDAGPSPIMQLVGERA